MKIIIYLVLCFLVLPSYSSISIVYNLRIAETSKRHAVSPLLPDPSIGLATLFATFRKKYNGVKHDAQGGLFTLAYAPDTFFLRVDAAVARVASDDHGVHFSRAQTDDLLFSGGYSPKISEKIRLTFSGLLGFPTHHDTSLDFVQFGYGHYGLGAQMDGSFVYSHNENHTLRGAARFIHFFPRTVCVEVDDLLKPFKFGIGNLADLFVAFHSVMKKHSVEAGYNASFFFGARICPSLDDVVTKSNYIRNNFYGIYKYRFLMRKTPGVIAAALSLGFEPTPKIYGNKRLVLFWTSFGVNF